MVNRFRLDTLRPHGAILFLRYRRKMSATFPLPDLGHSLHDMDTAIHRQVIVFSTGIVVFYSFGVRHEGCKFLLQMEGE